MLEKLREVAGEGAGGKKGGVSQFARRLLYRELQEPFPEGNLADLFDLAARVEDCLENPNPGEHSKALFSMLMELTRNEADQVRRNFAHQLLGKLAATMFEKSLLAFKNPPKLKP